MKEVTDYDNAPDKLKFSFCKPWRL